MFESCINEIMTVQDEMARTLYRKFKNRDELILETSNDQQYKGTIVEVEKQLYDDRETIKARFLSFELLNIPNIEIRYEIDRYDIRPRIIFIGNPSLLDYDNMTEEQQKQYIELSRELQKLYHRLSASSSDKTLTNDIKTFLKKFDSTGFKKPELYFTVEYYANGGRYY